MHPDQNKNKKEDKREPNVLPPTEVVQNPEPRANENIEDRNKNAGTRTAGHDSRINSEITDGEDA